jgi:multidrug efflux system outer membrane protein
MIFAFGTIRRSGQLSSQRAVSGLLSTRHSTSFACLAAIGLMLSGCKVGPEYERPPVDAPTEFRGAATQPATGPTTQQTLGDLPWWDAFGDATLKGLIETALENNYDLRIAVARIEQARALKMQAGSQYYPSAGYTAAAATGRDSFLGSPRPPEQINIPGLGTFGPDPYQDSFLAALSVAWEVDLWGRIRRSNEAALAQMLASEEARRDIGVSLIASVAQTYFELLELDLERQIALSTVKDFTDSLNLFQRKFEGGAASQLEVSRAESSQAQASASIPEIERQIILKENQLSILLGQNPGPHVRNIILDDIKTPEIPPGLPSQLLERRPDIRQAEDQVRSASAQIGVAAGNFFPRVGLSALYGGASTELSSLTDPSSVTSSIGASLTGPIFEGGLLVGQYKQAKAVWEQSKLQYQQSALTAFREVADALTSRKKLADVIVQQKRAVKAATQSTELAKQRYVAGKSAYFEVLDAQTQQYSVENQLAKAKLNELNAFVQLYKALGGGWSATDSAAASPAPATMPGH